MLVQIQNITKMFADEVVLQNVSLEIEPGARIGLLGANGAGKTTLLNLIAGSLEPDDGQLAYARGVNVGYLRQNDALNTQRTLREEIQSAFERQHKLAEKMQQLEVEMKAAPQDKALLAAYDATVAEYEAADGYSTDEKIGKVLNGLGFGSFNLDMQAGRLSGGEKTRFAFAKMLLSAPEVLMLDEPTNHLDFTMLSWLEGYLQSYKGAVLAVSHDRYFLDAVAKDVCEIEYKRLSRYKGGYTSFVQQKAQRQLVAQREYDKQQVEIAKMEDYVRRNMARASTSNMAKSRQKALERMHRLEKPSTMTKGIKMRFDYSVQPFSEVVVCQNLGASVNGGARQLFSGVELTVRRGEKLAIVGPNGIGKSTFLKAVQGFAEHSGSARFGGNVSVAYFDQELEGLQADQTVLQAVHSSYPQKTELEIRTALGRLLLEGDVVYKRVGQLSGAMRAKVAFAILQMRMANLLILDEPTNHLDYKAKEELERALAAYNGTIIVVSHDRYFLQRVPSAILEMGSGGFTRYEGGYDDYVAKKQGATPPKKQAEPAEQAEPKQTGGNYRSREQRAQDAQRRARIAQLEKLMQELESEISEAEEQLAKPENASDYARLSALSEELEQSNIAHNAALEEWMGLVE